MIGIRRALSLLILSFYVIYFAIGSWLVPDEMMAAFIGLALCYGLAFIALAAEWFWARWFAIGLGNFGSLSLLLLFQVEVEYALVVFGVSHLLVVLFLSGEGMAAKYEYSEQTAERWNFQEDSIALLRRAVKSAGSMLPFLILYALAPRQEQGLIQALALVGGVAGLFGLVRAKTWGPLALGATGFLCLLDGLGVFGAPTIGFFMFGPELMPVVCGKFGVFAGGLMLVTLPFLAPMARFLRRADAQPSHT
ncbi:hypothetical protein G6O69_14295 [Pseudenhygromyxa sp. WMMC2535]|uniref:hypothetical protein n=1 Tax=Pseudenhygromyxa sp. WMMC2535 TaxID=2712867 RepID=UPI001557D681|nr:hypothetical protein [Pseudenhygromyxa sp. WMMC2535]NVB39009.1 hypothetical protein [Pseudenhygromyxa sp. WMMC2535]